MVNRIEDGIYRTKVQARHSRGTRMEIFYFSSLVIAFLALIILIFTIINQSVGLVAVSFAVEPDTLVTAAVEQANGDDDPANDYAQPAEELTLADLNEGDLAWLLAERAGGQTLRLFYENVVNTGRYGDLASINGQPLEDVLKNDVELPEDIAARVGETTLTAEQEAELQALLDEVYGIELPEDPEALEDLTSPLGGRADVEALIAVPEDWDANISDTQAEIFSEFIDVGTVQNAIEDQIIDGGATSLTPPQDWQNSFTFLINDLSSLERARIIANDINQSDMVDMIDAEIVKTDINESWDLDQSIFNREQIESRVEDRYLNAELEWRFWLTRDFLTSRLTDFVETTGIRAALLGSLWLMGIVIVTAFPLGVGAAIYLEEYASDNLLNRIIETNIRNLAGVPSIIYGMLGLTIFVRTLSTFTDGRTVFSGGLTLALLILPIIIIQSQEALRAVPFAVREGSYGLGATQWQTISRQVLPTALPGIMTGTIIALSRAIGETAPLIVVGAATFISVDPNGPFSEFTALPIIIYNWTLRPEPEFQHAAGAAIILLLGVLLTMNSVAIYLRNRYSRRS